MGLVYRGGRLFLTEIRGRLRFEFLHKFLPPGTGADRLTIAGERGIWIHGALHEYAYEDTRGRLLTDRARLAGNTLLWRHGPLLLRLEGARSKAEALRIARSARAAR